MEAVRLKRFPFIVLALLFFYAQSVAKIHPDTRARLSSRLLKAAARPTLEFKAHNIGTLWNVFTNYGSFGDPNFDTTGRPSAEWPGGSRNRYL